MKVLKIAAIVIGVAALAVTGIGLAAGASVATAFGAATSGLAAGLGISAGVASAIVVGALAVDAMMLSSALTPKPKATEGSGGATDKWKADPRAGIPYSMGRSYTGGNIVFKRGHGKNNVWLTTVTVLSLGTIASIEASFADFNRLAFNGTAVTGSYSGAPSYDSNGAYIPVNTYSSSTGGYLNHFYESRQTGHLPETGSLTPPADAPTGWDASCKLSGLSAAMNSFKYDSTSTSSFTTIPQMGWLVKGVLVYDPRQDSTYPGGSGACRAGNESTYVYSENPGLHALTWCIGRFQNGTRVAGIGAPIDTLDVSSFVECANLCDARGWVIGGQVYTRPDTLWNSLQAILQAGGAAPVFYAGKITVINRAPKVSLATITRDDILGDVSFAATTARRDRINTVIPTYRSEDHQWQTVSAAAVSVQSYADLDGDERTKEIAYPLVQAVNQVAELALYDICDSREAGPGSIQCKPWVLNFRPGDCVTFQPEDGAAIKVQITGRTLDADTCAVTLDVRGETDAKHAFALGETGTAPPITTLHYDNAVAAPLVADWSITGTTVQANGTTLPAIDIEGSCSNLSADAILVEYRESSVGANAGWTATGIDVPSMKSKIITGVKPGTRYDIAISYRVRGIVGDRIVYPPVTTGLGAYDWSTVVGDNRPADNADVTADNTAKNTVAVGGISSDMIVGALRKVASDSDDLVAGAQALVDRASQNQITTLAAQLLAEQRKVLNDTQTHINGVPIGTQVVLNQTQQINGDQLLAQSISTVSAGVDTVGGRLTSEVTRLDRAIIDGDTAQATSLQTTAANLQSNIAGVDGRVSSEVTRLDTAIVTASQASATSLLTTKAELEGGIAGVDSRVTSEVTRLDSAVATGDKAQADSLQSTKAELEGNIAGVDSRVTSEVMRLDSSIATKDQAQAGALQTTKAELQRDINDVGDRVSSEVTRLDDAITTKDAAQATALQTVNATLSDRVTSEVTRLDTAISTQSGSTATSLSQLKSTVDGNTASVNLLFETINGEQATAALEVIVDNNGIAEITGVKLDGQQRSIVFSADKLVVGSSAIFQVDTTTGVVSADSLLVRNLRASTVTTDTIAANAVNNVIIAVDGAHNPGASDGSYSSMGATITSTGGVIRIDYSVAMSKQNNAGIAYVQLQRDMKGQTTVFGSSQYNAGQGGQAGVGQFSGFTLDTIPAGSNARYYFYYFYNTAAGAVVWNYEQILLTEIKR